jgi:hypothetical protein
LALSQADLPKVLDQQPDSFSAQVPPSVSRHKDNEVDASNVDFMLAEYKSLRDEVLARSNHQNTILTIVAALIASAMAGIIQLRMSSWQPNASPRMWDFTIQLGGMIFLFLPAAVTPLAMMFLFHEIIIARINGYLDGKWLDTCRESAGIQVGLPCKRRSLEDVPRWFRLGRLSLLVMPFVGAVFGASNVGWHVLYGNTTPTIRSGFWMTCVVDIALFVLTCRGFQKALNA